MSETMRSYLGLCLFFLGLVKLAEAGNQSQLLQDLFTNYYQGIVPCCGDTEKGVDVRLQIAIRSLINVDEPTQIVDINAWVRMSWTDCQLVWNASDYNGIDQMVLPYDKIWVPDVTLYDNNQDGGQGALPGLSDFRPKIKSDGFVQYNFPTVLHSMCTIDSTYFPFDTQTCPLKFGSWSYDGLTVNVVNASASADTSAFRRNAGWKLDSVNAVRHELFYSCCDAPYPDVTFYFTISRRSLSFVVHTLLPCFLIMFLALFGFLLPVESGEKVSLEITVLLALAVYAQLVSDQLPPSSNVPYMGYFFALSLLLTTLSLALTAFVVNLHHRGELGYPVNKVVRNIVLHGLAKIVLYEDKNEIEPVVKCYPASKQETVSSKYELEMTEVVLNLKNTKTSKKTKSAEIEIIKRSDKSSDLNSTSVAASPCPNNGDILEILRDQFKTLSYIKDTMFNDRNNDIKSDWERVSIVIDRFCFLLFTFLTVSASVSIAVLMAS